MMVVAPIVCAMIAWGDPPVAAPGPGRAAPSAATYEVMHVSSGVEIVVKRGGKPARVRLLGIDTPRTGAGLPVDRLNQTNHLRGLIAAGEPVRLISEDGWKVDAEGRLHAHVERASDGLPIGLAMLDQGYAEPSREHLTRGRAAFEATATKARDAKIGMWSPDFAAHATQPSAFVRRRRRARDLRQPQAIGMPFPGAASASSPGDSGSSGADLRAGPDANNGSRDFERDDDGKTLSPEEQRRRLDAWNEMQRREDARVRMLVQGFKDAVGEAQPHSVGPHPDNHPGGAPPHAEPPAPPHHGGESHPKGGKL